MSVSVVAGPRNQFKRPSSKEGGFSLFVRSEPFQHPRTSFSPVIATLRPTRRR